MTSSKPAPTDVVLFRSTPPRLRPIMIILTALALGLMFLGLTLTIVGNWPGYSPYGGNPLKVVGPILLALGIVVLIAISVDCCVRASKDDPGYYQKSFETITHDSSNNVYSHPKDPSKKLPPPEVHRGGIPSHATVIPLPTPPTQHRDKPYGTGKYNMPAYSTDHSQDSTTMAQPGYTGGAAPLARDYTETGRRGWGSRPGSHKNMNNSKPEMHLEVSQKSSAQAKSGTSVPVYSQVKPRAPTSSYPNGTVSPTAVVAPAQDDTTPDTSMDSAGPRKLKWGASKKNMPANNVAPPVLQMKPLTAESKPTGHQLPHKSRPSDGEDPGKGDSQQRDRGETNAGFQGDNLKDKESHPRGPGWHRHAHQKEPRPSEADPRSHRRSNSGRRKGSSRHRSHSRDKDRGGRSRDSSVGRSRETGGRRSASVEDLTAIDYTSGKPINRNERHDDERRHRKARDRSHDRDSRRDRSRSGDRRHRGHYNPAFEPDGHHHRSRGSPDHSRDSDFSERRRQHRNHSQDHIEPYDRHPATESKWHKPHDNTASEKSTSMDDLHSVPIKKTTVVNPKFTININAQAGAAVHIGLGTNTANSPRPPPMIKAGPTGITHFPAVQDSPGPRPT